MITTLSQLINPLELFQNRMVGSFSLVNFYMSSHMLEEELQSIVRIL